MKTYRQFNEDLKSWWNKGKNVRIPNEDTASWKTLWKDDVSQIGKVKNKTTGKLTNIPNPIWSFTKGLKTGPTPIQRQIVGRSVKTAKKALPLAGKVAKLVLSRGRKF